MNKLLQRFDCVMIAFVLRDQNEEANELAQGASGYKSLDVDIQLEEYPLVGCLVLNVEN